MREVIERSKPKIVILPFKSNADLWPRIWSFLVNVPCAFKNISIFYY